MNTHISKTILTAIGLLAAGAISFAQADASSLVLPKTSGPNFYLEASAGFMRADYDLDGAFDDLKNFFGGSVSFGYRINKNNKAQIELGVFAASASESLSLSDDGDTIAVSASLDMTAVPVLVSYSYCIPLTPDGRCELRLTPVAGLYNLKAKISASASGTIDGESGAFAGSSSASDTVFAIGAGVGFTYHFSPKFYLDAGYRYLHVGKTKFNDLIYDDETATIDATNNHCLNVSFGWKF